MDASFGPGAPVRARPGVGSSGGGGDMSDVHETVGSYVTDALDPAERAEFEQHLSSCANCWQEVGELRDTVAQLAELTSAAPPAALRASVLAVVRRTRPLPPDADPGAAGDTDTNS